MTQEVEKKLELFRQILLIRLCEKRIQDDWFNDDMKTPVHMGIGQEGIVVGSLSCFNDQTKLYGTYRCHPLYLARTDDPKTFFAEMYGKSTGCQQGKGGSMHLAAPDKGLLATSAVVGTTIPIAVGTAMANKIKGNDEYTIVYFGDGAVDEGVFWESINFAALHRLKILFVCEDNNFAIHTTKGTRHGYKNLAKTVDTLEFVVTEGTAYDVNKVVEDVLSLKQRMEDESKPGFYLVKYFRFNEHVGVGEDYHADYRKSLFENDPYEELDPLRNLEADLINNGVEKSKLEMMEKDALARIDEAVEFAKNSPFPTRDDLTTHLFEIENKTLI